MGITPWYVGQTQPAMQVTCQTDTGAVVNLTGATLTLVIRNPQSGVDSAGAGSWTITNASAGQASYAWAAADVATAGNFLLVFTATLSGGGAMKFDPVPWQLLSN